MKWNNRQRRTSVLGLSLADGKLRVVHATRAKSAAEVVKSASASLSLDLFHPEIELIGLELRNHLEAAHVRERHCVVALPARWVMSQHTRVPALGPEDTASLLAIEAEKGFPCDPDELQIARSSHRSEESGYVTQLAVRRDKVDRLAEVLKAAGLRPVSFTLGLPALRGAIAPVGEGRITLELEPAGATLLISAGGGIVAFRTLEATIDSEEGEHVVNGAALARELRITFEQVPPDLRAGIRQLCLRGEPTMSRHLRETLANWAREAGLSMAEEVASTRPVVEEMTEQLALRYLAEGATALEFLPPRPSRWARLFSRYSSRRLAVAGFATAAAAVLALGIFGWQEYRLLSLRSEWSDMAEQVKDLDTITARIREFRPWYDTSYRSLTIVKRIVECFPENGSVTAKAIEIHGQNNISVTGTARDNASLLQTLDQLRQAREVRGLKIEQIRGKAPAQFTFTFRWLGNTGT